MSGTSLDGVDVVIARLQGSGREMTIDVLGSSHTPYPSPLEEVILRNTNPASSSVREITQLHARLGHIYADAVARAAANCGVIGDLDLVGSHGQTLYHQPDPEPFCGQHVSSTLQLGDTSAIANRLETPVVGDFRLADMALNGEGAPLAPYFDYVYFTHPEKSRILLNIGGIANLTYLQADGSKRDVRAFDTGPGNMLIDGLMQRLFDEPLDRDGMHARQGAVCERLLEWLLEDDAFLHESPPKSTGREYYGPAFLNRLTAQAERFDCTNADLIATVTAFTARSIYDACERFIAPHGPVDALIASGGGVHNPVLMDMLADAFSPVPVVTTAAYDVHPDIKEALCFAVLAHEFLNGVPTNMPSVTGAARATLLGKLAVPLME